tara:strand:+ start:111 stop:743 length:633 start_codon:yes stop_codon:yes gene_type:complete
VIFKICGLKEKDSILCCEANNVDFFGLIFYKKSPRNISYKNAKELINFATDLRITPVGVFVNQGITDLKDIITYLNLKHIQLHGDESQEYINEIKNTFSVKIIKKFSIESEKDLIKVNQINNIDYFLFDYKPSSGELPGGNSKSFDWNLLKNAQIKLPWFVSGGINESNIKNIKKTLNPNGIDLSSGVEESLGKKSNEKINNLLTLFYDN